MGDESDEKAKLAIMEHQIKTINGSMIEMQGTLKEMMNAMQTLATAEAKRSALDEMIGRLFKRLEVLEKWRQDAAEADAKEKVEEAKKEAQKLEKELDKKEKRIWDVRSSVITAVLGMIAWLIADKIGLHVF